MRRRGNIIHYIALKLGTTKQSATHIVDTMERKKYLSVTENERDKRTVKITITLEGEQAFQACSKQADDLLADISHDFTTEEPETLWTLFHKLYRFDGIAYKGIEAHAHHNRRIRTRTETSSSLFKEKNKITVTKKQAFQKILFYTIG